MTGSAARSPTAADINQDPYSREVLLDPYPYYEQLREAGAVVWLDRWKIWAFPRYREITDALNDWKTFTSARGVGHDDFTKQEPWRPPSLILEADPPMHTRTRGVLTRIMSPVAMRRLRETFQREADILVDRLVERGTFDGVTDLAEVYPIKVFPDSMGLAEDGRENLLPYGSMVFNGFGPRNDLFVAAMEGGEPVRSWVMKKCSRSELEPGGFGSQIYDAADAGDLTEQEAGMLCRTFLSAGVDTTVGAIGLMMLTFARFPDQYKLLRENPALARGAFEEVLRFEAPFNQYFRTTTRPITVAGTELDEGTKVLLIVGSGNRDPRHWENPDAFDITRKAIGHLAFSAGIHGCVGQMLARLEGECVLNSFVRKAASIELVGEPIPRFNNTMRLFNSIPLSVRPSH
ncbi:MAG: cytochrome P450 [Bradyrhizobium sp.]